MGLGRGEQEGTPFKLVILSGGEPMLHKLESCSCSPLPSPTLKWQVIASLQLCRKEQEGTCDFEGGSNGGKKRHSLKTCDLRGGTADKFIVPRTSWTPAHP